MNNYEVVMDGVACVDEKVESQNYDMFTDEYQSDPELVAIADKYVREHSTTVFIAPEQCPELFRGDTEGTYWDVDGQRYVYGI